MKILIVSAFPPCQKTAGQDYTRRMINSLIKNGYEISLIYSLYPNHLVELPSSVKILKVIKPSFIKCFGKISFHPFFTKRYDKKILNYIKSISEEFDMIYFDFSQVQLYSLYVEHPNKVLMCHDVISQKYFRKNKNQLWWIKKSEFKILSSSKHIITFSKKDCNFIKEMYGLNSSNVNFYLKNEKFKYTNSSTLYEKTFCFYGAWNRIENNECLYEFLNNIYLKLNNDIKIIIIGGGLPEKLTSLLNIFPKIEIKGFVDNPVYEISKCQALIAPLKHGAGVKVKVIDAFTSGTKVLGTDITFEGIEDNSEMQLFVKIKEYSDLINILNNWEPVTIGYKQKAADEFYNRYDSNHFSDIIEKLN